MAFYLVKILQRELEHFNMRFERLQTCVELLLANNVCPQLEALTALKLGFQFIREKL